MPDIEPHDPAFPYEDNKFYHHGMTLRVWLAGQALTGLCMSEDPSLKTPRDIGSAAVNVADEVIAALNRAALDEWVGARPQTEKQTSTPDQQAKGS